MPRQKPHIQIVLDAPDVPPHLERALGRTAATVSFRPMADALGPGVCLDADAVVIVPGGGADTGRMRTLLNRLADRPRATLVVPVAAPGRRYEHPAAVPVSYADSESEDALAARLATLLDVGRSLDALHRGAAARTARDSGVISRYREQLRVASRMQREFLPPRLPKVAGLSFRVVYRPLDFVSGDMYDVQRLDDEHVSIALADSTGHGIPAALLTVFIKRALRGKDSFRGRSVLLQPDEVLARLNEELVEAGLSECRFVAVTYALINLRTRVASVARGGAPYPILRRADGRAQLLRPSGSVAGVMADARFAVESVTLGPGDGLLIYSDGVENLATPHLTGGLAGRAFGRAADLLRAGTGGAAQCARVAGEGSRQASGACANAEGGAPGCDDSAAAMLPPASATPADEMIVDSPWFETLRQRGIPAALDQFAARCDVLRRIGHPLDDVTAVCVIAD